MSRIVSFVCAAVLTVVLALGDDEQFTTRTVDFEVSEGTNLAFDLSPDGQSIVFDLLGQLWLLPVRGGVARQLTDAARDTADDAGPTFSPDGRWIAFQSDRPGGLGLFRVPVAGGEVERLTTRARDQRGGSNPAWSPDGRSIAWIFRDTLYLVDADQTDGRSQRPVRVDFPNQGPRRLGSAAWSPTGDRLAVGTGEGGAFLPFPGNSGIGVWEVPAAGGLARQVTPEGVTAVSPAYAPDGARIAFFAPDSVGAWSSWWWQLWIREYPDGPAQRVTNQPGMAVRRVRWTPDGRDLIYAANGRLWRVSASGGEPTEIPFTVHVRFERRVAHLPPVKFPESGTQQQVRGFEGLALSQDGRRIAMIALEELWVWNVGDSARLIADLPPGATSPSWSANGAEVAFSAGDLFAADAGDGTVRRLTSFGGKIETPTWSPDGRYIAFIHGRECDGVGNCSGGLLRLIEPTASEVIDLAQTVSLGTPLGSPVWRPDSKALLTYDPYRPRMTRVYPLSGRPWTLRGFPAAATFFAWTDQDSVLFIRRNVLWRAPFDTVSGEIGSPIALTDHAAMYPTAAASGDVLYVSGDGLRYTTREGNNTILGWPATFRVPAAPPPLLIRNARIIDGYGGSPVDSLDILVEGGRIARLSPTAKEGVAQDVTVLDAGGRTVVPGFIDTHQHFWSPREEGDLRMLGGLYHGTTTFRDAGSTLAQIADQRDLVVSGRLPGPRLVVAGPIFQGYQQAWLGLTDPFNLFVVDSVDIARGLNLVAAFGARFAKHRSYFNWASLTTLIDEAHRRGMRTSGHCTASLAAVAAGADGQEHPAQCYRDFNRVHEDFARLKTEAGMWVTANPTLGLTAVMDRDDPSWRSRLDIAAFLPVTATGAPVEPNGPTREELFSRHLRWRSLTTALHDLGVDLAIGTDEAPMPNITQVTLRTLVDAGMTPLEAITAATRAPARVIGAEADIGTIEVGKLADLVILDGDPLEDIANTERISLVMKGGEVVDREALLRLAAARRRVGWPR